MSVREAKHYDRDAPQLLFSEPPPLRDMIVVDSHGPVKPVDEWYNYPQPASATDLQLDREYPMRARIGGEPVPGYGKAIDGGYLELRSLFHAGMTFYKLWLFRKNNCSGAVFQDGAPEDMEKYCELFRKVKDEKSFRALEKTNGTK